MSDKQFPHAALPAANHDELARQDFTMELKRHISASLTAPNRSVAELEVLPAFMRRHERRPRDRHELRGAMEEHPFHQMWGSLTRLSQELMWGSVEESVSRQLGALIEGAKPTANSMGSLRLSPDVRVPRYVSAVDIHAMPGGYASEVAPDDVRAGAVFDRGTFLNVCGTQGPTHDARGKTAIAFLKTEHAGLRPARILDMGCSIGQSTVPYADHFPRAEVHAIDVAAPMLRYGHARARSLGAAVHFSQQNAEETDFEDESFALIVSHLLFHETSTKALPRILRECHRLLRKGGVMVHLELGMPYHDMDLFEEVMHDWQTYYNAEPFWAKINTTDTAGLARAAGFATARNGYLQRSDEPAADERHLGHKSNEAASHVHPQGDRGSREFFWVLTATK